MTDTPMSRNRDWCLEALVNAERAVAHDPVRLEIEANRTGTFSPERTETRRIWAALMLARNVDAYDAIRQGKPVLVALLSRVALRKAFRDKPLPEPDELLTVSPAMLDGIAEAGALPLGKA